MREREKRAEREKTRERWRKRTRERYKEIHTHTYILLRLRGETPRVSLYRDTRLYISIRILRSIFEKFVFKHVFVVTFSSRRRRKGGGSFTRASEDGFESHRKRAVLRFRAHSSLLLLVRLRRRLSRAFQSLDFSRLFKPFRDVWEKRERNEPILTHHCFPFASSSTETHSDFRAFRERALSVNLPHKRIKRPS